MEGKFESRAPSDGPPGSEGVAVVGDIHGRLDRLDRVLGRIPKGRPLVFLGDYIDRGPDSRGVVERLMQREEEGPCVLLCGNHEDMLLDALSGAYPGAEDDWLLNGGDATLRSYGATGVRHLTELIPEAHVRFYRRLREHWETEQYVFVHAGIRADGPDRTDRQTKLWLRVAPDESFGYGKSVICGHTPYSSPLRGPDWINIDTGCGKLPGAPLTALLLPEMEIIQG
jgi:serine/threonine protein phosphatase 1